MTSSPTHSFTRLEDEYAKNQRELDKGFFTALVIIMLSITIGEGYQSLSYSKIALIIIICFMLLGWFFVLKLLCKADKSQDARITVFCIAFYFAGLFFHYRLNSGNFANALDAFYFAYAYGFMERMMGDRILILKHKISFSCTATIGRLLLIPVDDLVCCLIQLAFMGLGSYLDYQKSSNDKFIFQSYNQHQEQLVKFKSLLAHDIEESTIVVTRNISQCLFMSDSFKDLLGGKANLPVQAQLSQFSVEDSRYKNASDDPQSQILTLVDLLKANFEEQKEFGPVNDRLSCNLTYTRTPKSFSNDERSQLKENQEHKFEAKVFNILWDNQSSIVIVLHDITQQNMVRNLKIADANKDDALATVSHELRTPLNSMLGMMQIMQKKLKDDELAHYLSICKNSGNLLLGLVNSVLDMNQIRCSKLKLYAERFNVSDLMRDILSLFGFQCKQKGLYLKLNIAPGTSCILDTDRNRLRQIFINLVGNALKFTYKGGITIRVSESEDPGSVRFTIEDTGVGIQDEDKVKLFKTFGKLDQADNTLNRQGVGLGLTISDKLAKLLSSNPETGGIEVASQYGKGSRFSFSIKKKLFNATEDDIVGREGSPGSFVPEDFEDLGEKMMNYSMSPASNSRVLERSQLQSNRKHGIFRPISPKSNRNLSLTNERNSNILQTSKASSSICSKKRTSMIKNDYILVVDDNPLNTTVAEYLISSCGYKVKTALYGNVAIDLLLQHPHEAEPIKLILMDCQMPLLDGYETTKILKELMEGKKIPEIPIVALTANDSNCDRELCTRVGMCDYLRKPLNMSELERTLAKFVGSHHSV